MRRTMLAAGRDLPAMPFDFDRRDERIVQSVRRLAMTVAHTFGVSGAFVALYESTSVLQIVSCFGVDLVAYPESGFLSSALVTPGHELIVPDVEQNPAFANDVWATNAGIRFFAGAPLIDASGHPAGYLCLVDLAPRLFTSAHRQLLGEMAAIGVSELSTHHRLRAQEQALFEARDRLSRAEQVNERLTADLPLPLFSVDSEGCVLTWNRACVDVIGFKAEEMIGQKIGRLVADGPVSGSFDTIIRRVFNRRRISGLDLRLRTRRGEICRLCCRLIPEYDEAGRIAACTFIAQDRTAHHRLEKHNQELTAQSRLAADIASTCSFWIVQDADNTFWLQRASASFVAATGIEVGRKRALPWADLLHPEDLADALATYRSLEPHQSATVMARLRTARTGPGLMPHAVCLVEQDMRTRVRRYLGVMRSVAPAADDWTAKAIDQLKGSILSTMSHEFRTPLTAILGFAELLTEETDSTQRHLAERIEHSAHRLLRTLGDILDLAQIENQLMPFQKEATDFAIHVSTVAAPFVHAAIAKGLSWRFLEPESPVSVAIDTEASARALKHVFDNAVKFTEQGGVELTLIVRSEEALLSITDTGIGMGEEFLPHAFVEFRQENGDIVRPFEGSGLGLALVKKLVMALAGRVEIASRKGVGTTVTIVYPLAPTA